MMQQNDKALAVHLRLAAEEAEQAAQQIADAGDLVRSNTKAAVALIRAKTQLYPQ